MSSSTLYHEIAFVFADVARPEANVSAGARLRRPGLSCDARGLGVLNAFDGCIGM